MKPALPPRADLKQGAVQRVFDVLADAVLLLDGRGAVLYANPAAQALLGAAPGFAASQLGPSLGGAAVEWLQRALRLGPAGTLGAAGAAPRARLDDGRSARLALVPIDAQRFALHVNPIDEPAVAATESGPIPLADTGSELMRMFWDSPFASTLQDLDFRLVAVNRAYVEFTGFPESMLVGLDPLSLQPEEDRAVNLALRKQMKVDLDAGKPPPLIERRIIDAAGRERWFRAMRRAVRDTKGRTLLLAVLQDVTDEHHARALSERSLRELEQWFDLSPIGMVLIDAVGLLVRGNAAFEALAGTAPVSLAEAEPGLRELFGWGERGPALALQPGAPPIVNEAFLSLPRGGLRKLRATVRCAEGAGAQRRYLAVIEDRSHEEERDLARLQVSALVDAAGVGLATFHESLGWLDTGIGGGGVSPGPAAALQAINRDIVLPSSLPDFERLQQALRDGQQAEVRYAVRHPDIGLRWLLTRVEPGALASGPRAVTLDVTEQQLARSRTDELLRELATILDSTTAGIAFLRGDRLVRCNRRFRRMLGLSGKGLAGAPLSRIAGAHPRAAELIEAALRALQDTPLFETEFEVVVDTRKPQTPPAWYSLSVRRSAGTSGEAEATAVLTDVTRLKAQQAELQTLARDHELLFSLSDIGIGYLRGDRIERANDALARLTGYAADALAGLDHAVLFEDRAEYLRITALQRVALRSAGHWSGERRLKCADGSLIWVQVSKRLIVAAAGQRTSEAGAGIVASYVNVDDRRRAEESLVAQSERTRAILDSALVGIVSVGPGGIVWMNRSARRMFGGELADFIDQPISVVATDAAEHPFRRTQQLLVELEEGEARSFECRVQARDGRRFWVAGNAVLTGRETHSRQLTYALLDIDRRREAEAITVQTQASLRRIIEMAPLAIVLRDAASLRVLEINHIAAIVIGRPEDDIVGRTPTQLYSAESAAQLSADMRAALAAGEGVVTRREYKLAGAGGDPRVWEVRYQPLASLPGRPPDQLLSVAADVTEQRAAEAARLEAVIAQRELLVREVHHRIKNNLQGVAGLLQQIAQRRPEVAPVIGEAIGQVQAIAQVYGLQVGAAGPLRVNSVVEAIVGSVARLHGRPIAFAVAGEARYRWALPEAESIPIALSVNELLNNAVKHAGVGEIVCTLTCDDGEVRIAISNPGVLPAGFDLARVPAGVSGLGLVRALLPRRSATLSIAARDGRVQALVVLVPPGVAVLDPL